MFCLASYSETELENKSYGIEPVACFTPDLPWFAQLPPGMFLSTAVPFSTSVMTAVWAVAQQLITPQAVHSDILPPRLKPSAWRPSESVEGERVHFSASVGVVAPVSIDYSPRLCLAAATKQHIVQHSLLLFYRLSGHSAPSIQPLAHASQREHILASGPQAVFVQISECYPLKLLISNPERKLGHWCHGIVQIYVIIHL